jgi:hypothetical protein
MLTIEILYGKENEDHSVSSCDVESGSISTCQLFLAVTDSTAWRSYGIADRKFISVSVNKYLRVIKWVSILTAAPGDADR